MNKRTGIALLQNAVIFLLSLSALFLLLRVLSYETGQIGQSPVLSDLLSTGHAATTPAVQSTDLTDMAAPFNLVITSTYGRSSILSWDGSSTIGEPIRDLFSEALGSADALTAVDESTFRAALSFPGIYIDYLTALQSDVVAGRLGATFSQSSPIRHLLITKEQNEGATLYLWDGSSSVCRYDTAASVTVLEEIIATYSADDTFFAFEGEEGYAHLSPYSLMRRSAPTAAVLTSSIPALATDSAQLLSLLDFNVHTESRYRLTDGTEVVVESPRKLSIHPDGTTVFTGDESTVSPLFRLSSAGGTPTATEAVLAARNLAEVLFAGEAFAFTDLYLSDIQAKNDGWILRFSYMANGTPVYFSGDLPAWEVEITGRTITAFTLRWRQYTPSEESYTLLPARQAAAIAADYRRPFLTIGYADNGGSTLHPTWLAQ